MNISFIILIIAFGVLIFTVWNLLTLRGLSKRTSSNKELNDSKYYELKYKYGSVVAIGTFGIAVLTIFGYNSIENIEKKMSEDIERRIDSTKKHINNLDHKAAEINKRVSISDSKIELVNYRSELLLRQIRSNGNKAANLTQKFRKNFDSLTQKQYSITQEMLKQSFYIVDSLIYLFDERKGVNRKLNFKDLKTNKGEHLPIFKNTPFVTAISKDEFPMFVVFKDADSLIVSPKTMNVDKIVYSLFISETP